MSKPAVTLEPFGPEDVSTLVTWLRDPYLLGMTAPDWTAPLTEERVRQDYLEHPSRGEVLRASSDGRMVGHLGLRPMSAGVGLLYHVIVGPEVRGQGYGLAMVEAVADLAFSERNMHRLHLSVFEENVAAIACYLRAGFRVEGHHRETFVVSGRRLNTYSMALLESEWRSRRMEDRG